jgi:sulfopyruvate decarboxylase TPP-binding subunit
MIYRQPCILLVSWRGFQGQDAPEHLVMGETMVSLLDTMKIPHRTLSEQTLTDDFRWIGHTFMQQRVPLALLIKKGTVKALHP